MKKQQLVQIPVGHICLSAQDYNILRQTLYRLDRENHDLRVESGEFQAQNHDLEKKLADAERKIEELQRDIERRSDAMLYWNKEYEKLQKQLKELTDGGSGNAETKEA